MWLDREHMAWIHEYVVLWPFAFLEQNEVCISHRPSVSGPLAHMQAWVIWYIIPFAICHLASQRIRVLIRSGPHCQPSPLGGSNQIDHDLATDHGARYASSA